MPSFETFETYARRIEDEMSPAARATNDEPPAKRCPACGHDCQLGEPICPECGHEFPVRPPRLKKCNGCGALNPVTAPRCHTCGASFAQSFSLTLDEALRTGAIVRGMDIEETDVRAAEQMAPMVRQLVLQSGDQRLVRILQTLPDESWARLRSILVSNG
jgi:predicted amidophosphoribosyltransferase